MTDSEFSFEMCYASTIVNFATISDLTKLRKVLKYIKFEKSCRFPSLNIDSLSIRIYTDTSFNKLPNGGSQGGQIVFSTDNENQSCPLVWNSLKIKRVVQSTYSAETLSMTDGCDISFFTTQIVNHIFQQRNIKNIVITDNKSLLDCIQSTKLIRNKHLRVESHALCQLHEKNEIEIIWIPTRK